MTARDPLLRWLLRATALLGLTTLAGFAYAFLQCPPTWSCGRDRRAASVQLRELGVAIELFQLQNGRYPTSREGLEALTTNATPFIRKVPTDPWDNPYVYRAIGPSFAIHSVGPDGRDNTADDVRWSSRAQGD